MELYVERGNWQCSESPTGAHHDMLGQYPGDDGPLVGRCKWCGRERNYPRWAGGNGNAVESERAEQAELTSKVA